VPETEATAGYRDSAARKRVLGPPEEGLEALAVACGPLDTGSAGRAITSGFYVLFAVIVALVLHRGILFEYHSRVWHGEPVQGVVRTKEMHPKTYRRGSDHYLIVADTADGSRYSLEVGSDDYDRLREGGPVPLMVVPGYPEAAAADDKPVLDGYDVLLALLVSMLFVGVFASRQLAAPTAVEGQGR
jgi:hypothetical protein